MRLSNCLQFVLLALLFRCAVPAAHAQSGAPPTLTPLTAPFTRPTPPPGQNAANSVRVLYTGSLFGYFRVPDGQPRETGGACAKIASQHSYSPAALFERMKQAASAPNAILVGTGDNFAPEIEAREFCPPPPPPVQPSTYQPARKEFYSWDDRHGVWIRNELVDKDPNLQWLKKELARGNGTIPTDNVASFFVQEGYAAIVPGKHDFYFGPERLRELARFLASKPIPNTIPPRYVQMLGANLVIETTWKSDHKPLADTENPPKFIVGFPTAQQLLPKTSLKMQFSGLHDGGKVYPWFEGPNLKIDLSGSPEVLRGLRAAPTPDCLSKLKQRLQALLAGTCRQVTITERERAKIQDLIALASKVHAASPQLCGPVGGNPNAIPIPLDVHRCRKIKVIPRVGSSMLYFDLQFPWSKQESGGEYSSVVTPGENYGLCLVLPKEEPKGGASENQTYCVRFSVYWPFFYYPSTAPSLGKRPVPYVLIQNDGPKPGSSGVAIFGVVDPDILTYAGALNYRWRNQDRHYMTQAVAEDPGEALKELLEFFALQHPRFHGIEILLAEMSPQRAQALAARVGRLVEGSRGFDVVVSAADYELATGRQRTIIEGREKPYGGEKSPPFLAVPDPYYVPEREPAHQRLRIGSLQIPTARGRDGRWQFISDSLSRMVESASEAATDFWRQVQKAARSCLVEKGGGPGSAEALPDHRKLIQDLTLCAMQTEVRADVALAQERDFFLDLPDNAGDLGFKPSNLQDLLDRIIWKGDFLTLMYVPGSALAKAMEQSKKYDQDDASDLSLSDEKGRGLVSLGLRPDPNGGGGYFINQVPLDPSRLYAVATTDYIGAGDTGYPDLAAAAVNPPVSPRDFGPKLTTVSGLVCRQVARNPKAANADCLAPIESEPYFDETDLRPMDQRRGESWAGHLWRSIVPGGRGEPIADAAERRIEERGLGSLRINPPNASSLVVESATLSVNAVSHKFSDAELGKTFPPSNVPELSAPRSHTISFDIRPKYTYSWNHVEFFQGLEFNYDFGYTGRSAAPHLVNQIHNLFSSDTGVAFHIPDRALWHFEPVVTFHYDTQLTNPPLSFFQKFAGGNTTLVPPIPRDRTHYLLPRVGVRYVGENNSMEVGLEEGEELKAIRLVSLPPAAPGGQARILVKRSNLHVAGAYWNWHFTLPFTSRVSWQNDEDGQYYFNNHGDNPADIRFLSRNKTGLKFKVWDSLAFGPAYELFLYSNKVQGIWFWQGQAAIEMNLRFDLWNHRDWWTKQIRYKSGAR